MKKIKVLQFPMGNAKDGVTQYAFENWRFIDKSRFQFDFATLSKERFDFEDRLASQGCKVHYIACHAEIDREQFIRDMHKIFDESYDVLHLHTSSWKSFLVEQIAIERKVPVIIVHSHNTMVLNENEDERKQALEVHERQKTLFSIDLATHFCTCSQLATDWLFGEQIPRDRIMLMKNAIDIELFSYNPSIRQQYRKELGLDDCFVIGHVGRFKYQKNHDLLIDILKQVCAKVPQARLLMIGTGELEDSIRKKVHQYGLDDKVVFMGKRDDVNYLLQAMDVFLLPSRFEGLPIVLVEAQASGLKCLTSTLVTNEVALTNNIEFIALDDIKGWVENTVSYAFGYERRKMDNVITARGYNIRYQIKKLENIYSNISI